MPHKMYLHTSIRSYRHGIVGNGGAVIVWHSPPALAIVLGTDCPHSGLSKRLADSVANKRRATAGRILARSDLEYTLKGGWVQPEEIPK